MQEKNVKKSKLGPGKPETGLIIQASLNEHFTKKKKNLSSFSNKKEQILCVHTLKVSRAQ